MFGMLETGIIIAVLAIIGMTAANTLAKARVSKALMENAAPYEALTTDYAKTLLILGDSIGVGVGADRPEDTLAGRLAAYLGATYVENQAVSGAEVLDLSTQIQRLRLTHYDVILVQIGGNDILAFHGAKKTAADLARILDTLPDAGKVIIMGEGNVGGATMFPHVVRFLHHRGSRAFHKEFAKIAASRGATYVNLYRKPSQDPFFKDPRRYLSADGLHPSSDGYALWFEQMKGQID